MTDSRQAAYSLLCGCGRSEQERKVNVSSALRALETLQTATVVHETRSGGSASLALLLEDDPSRLIDDEFGAVWDGHPRPSP